MNRNELADSVNALVERSMPVDVPEDSEYIAATVEACRGRFTGTGTKYQISDDEQSFERSSIGTMLKGKREELQDGVNYAVMLDILVGREFAAEEVSGEYGRILDRIRLYCETVTCLLVDFDRELQEMIADLVAAGKYVETSGEYVETLAAEVNAKSGADELPVVWQVIEAQWRPAEVDEAESALRAATVGGLQDKTLFGVAVDDYPYNGRDADGCERPSITGDVDIDNEARRRSVMNPDTMTGPSSDDDGSSQAAEDAMFKRFDRDADVGDYAVDIARMYDDGCGVVDDES